MKLTRREAIKLLGISPFAASALATTPSEGVASEDIKSKIVIVGAGASGIMVLAKLFHYIDNPDITVIAPNKTHIYQPGQVFVAAHEMEYEDLFFQNSDYIGDDVKWIQEEAASFKPETNEVITDSGKAVQYDFLIIATGVVYRYDKIKGLKEEDIGTNGIASVYLNDPKNATARGAKDMAKWFDDLKNASKIKKQTVVYTNPDTPIKCGGAPQKMLYLSADYLKKEGLSGNYIFATGLKKLFHLEAVDKELKKVQKRYDTITTKYSHFLKEIDVKNKKAKFIHAYETKEYDEDFEEYVTTSKSDEVVLEYDFIHVVPPMEAPKPLIEAGLCGDGVFLDVDKVSLQHKKYKNIFGIGDVCGIPMGKTGGSARHHAPVVAKNLISQAKGESPKEKFDGYTVCPIKTQYGKILMAEFNYKGPKPTIPFLAIEEPRWFWWVFDLYMLEPMYKHLMLRGYM